MNNELMTAYWRRNKGAGTKLAMPSRVLLDTLTRLTCCTDIFVQGIQTAHTSGVALSSLMSLVGACDLLEAIISDLYEETRAAGGLAEQ